jgi:hypothetical protein
VIVEESGEYRVTIHEGRGPHSDDATVIFRSPDEGRTMAFYYRCTPPQPGTVVAVWRPDGSLIAYSSGPTR